MIYLNGGYKLVKWKNRSKKVVFCKKVTGESLIVVHEASLLDCLYAVDDFVTCGNQTCETL